MSFKIIQSSFISKDGSKNPISLPDLVPINKDYIKRLIANLRINIRQLKLSDGSSILPKTLEELYEPILPDKTV